MIDIPLGFAPKINETFMAEIKDWATNGSSTEIRHL